MTKPKFQKRKKMSCHQGNKITFAVQGGGNNLATKSRDLFLIKFSTILINSKIIDQLEFLIT